ncbi:MAG: SMI1/KNR4 family protein [Alphaproteobacteria bacterium]|nr:SMI1/KNR4 family protein [Alphaproteobacteria bacterium]MCB9794354.1 SMI1/KNR4 family protein [Alphaproteobacteria bacterium]
MLNLNGKKAVLTGTFSTLTRADAAAALEAAGCKVQSKVGYSTDYIFYGADYGSKVHEAWQYNARIANERELLAALGRPLEVTGLSGPLSDFVARYEAMVDALSRDPSVRIVNDLVKPPLSEEAIAALEARWGGRLSPALRNLYLQTDGIVLRWIFTNSEHFDNFEHRLQPGEQGFNADEGRCDGALRIGSLEELLFRSWEGEFVFDFMTNEQTEDFAGEIWGQRSFHEALRVFDTFNHYNMAALVLRPGEAEGPVILGDDHGACWTDSRRVGFETYMEGQIKSLARVQTRRDVLGVYAGHQQPLVEDWPEEPLRAAGAGGLRARRVWYATEKGAFKREGETWVRVGDGLGTALAEKGRAQRVNGMDVDKDGRPVIATYRSAFRLPEEGDSEKLLGGPQNAWADAIVCGAQGEVALLFRDRILLQRAGDKKATTLKTKALGNIWPRAGAFLPDSSLLTGESGGLVSIAADGAVDAVSLPEPGKGKPRGEGMSVLRADAEGRVQLVDKGVVYVRDAEGSWTASPVKLGQYTGDFSSSGLVEVEGLGELLTAYALTETMKVRATPEGRFETWAPGEDFTSLRPGASVPDGQGGTVLTTGKTELLHVTAEGITPIPWEGDWPEGTEPRPDFLTYDVLRRAPDGRLWLAGMEAVVGVELVAEG